MMMVKTTDMGAKARATIVTIMKTVAARFSFEDNLPNVLNEPLTQTLCLFSVPCRSPEPVERLLW
jgi:hypothetical protein